MPKSALQLLVLGDLSVVRDTAVVVLPQSKRARALLAYLALSPRPLRRERLCEMFWAVPDDRRGWAVLRRAQVDLINTDDLAGLRAFLISENANY